jgi:Sec-independent protein translocase protein TatA
MSFWELMVIFLVALLVIPPKRLPEVAYFFGQTFRKVKQWYTLGLQKLNTPP